MATAEATGTLLHKTKPRRHQIRRTRLRSQHSAVIAMGHPTPYPELNAVLRELVATVQVALGDEFVSACLQGSFALGGFDRHSDVDFVIAVRDDLTDRDVDSLQTAHARIFQHDCEWAQHLEGSYFPLAILRDYRHRARPVWYLDHGSSSLIQSDHCNTIVVRWVVRERGVTLAGQEAATLVDPIPVAALRKEIRATIHEWGREILGQPDRYRNRFYQGFIVLSYCRMLHDLIAGQPGSKGAGAAWAKANVAPSWSALIDRAWECRPNPAVAAREPADADDFDATLEFVRFMIGASERYAQRIEEADA